VKGEMENRKARREAAERERMVGSWVLGIG